MYCNNKLVGGHHYGYSSFSCLVESGVIAVKVDNSPKHGADRWYSGCGIYRPVTLTICNLLHVSQYGIIIVTELLDDNKAEVKVKINIDNKSGKKQKAEVVVNLTDANSNIIASNMLPIEINSNDKKQYQTAMIIENPSLWDINSPNLYDCQVKILRDDIITDELNEPFGIRRIEFVPHKGLFLNNRNVKIKGVNLHHDLGVVGSAWNKAIAKDRLETLKAIGCNAIRTSHNPPASELLDLCDQMGFLVMDEAFDKWDTLRYGKIFEENWQDDVSIMVARDRNHPCIIMWSIGNEVNHQGHPDMIDRLKKLSGWVKKLDKNRPVTFAMEPHGFDVNQIRMTPLQKAQLTRKMLEHDSARVS